MNIICTSVITPKICKTKFLISENVTYKPFAVFYTKGKSKDGSRGQNIALAQDHENQFKRRYIITIYTR